MISRIVSGGQSGADRAALDWAITHGYPHGGWCPKGRKAEDGMIDARYWLAETATANYQERTRLNVADSDGTLIVNLGELEGGTLATQGFAEELGKPLFLAQMDDGISNDLIRAVVGWIRGNSIVTLNVAGPREGTRPGIYRVTWDFLDAILK